MYEQIATNKTVRVTPRGTDRTFECTVCATFEHIDSRVMFHATAECEETSRKKNFTFSVPHIREDRTIAVNGCEYNIIPLLREPIITWGVTPLNYSQVPVAWIQGIDPIAEKKIGLRHTEHTKCITEELPPANAVPVDKSKRIERICFDEDDRSTFNEIMGTVNTVPYLTAIDLSAIERMLGRLDKHAWRTENVNSTILRESLPVRNDLQYMRVVTLEDILTRAYTIILSRVLRHLPLTGTVDERLLQQELDLRVHSVPWCQRDKWNTKIAMYALRNKIRLPWLKYDMNIEPHDSWKNALCCVDTPQDGGAGNVLAMCDGSYIENGRLKAGKHNLSGVLRKTLTFPHLIDEYRQVVASALVKQSVDLGRDGELNESPYLTVEGTGHIPYVPGTHLRTALTHMTYTHEDGCIISQSAADKLTTFRMRQQVLSQADEPLISLMHVGDVLAPEQIVARGKSVAHRTIVNLPSTVRCIDRRQSTYYGSVVHHLTITTETEYKCIEGSKLAGLHSNKHIVSCVWSVDKMPHDEQGLPVEMVISPASIYSRRNPSLIMEIMLNTYCEHVSKKGKVKAEFTINEELRDTISFGAVANILENTGLPSTNTICLRNGRSGKLSQYMTLVGPLFIMRLAHHAPDKLKIGNNIPVDQTGRQLKGHGPQRLGREELEVLWGLETEGLLAEIRENSRSSGALGRVEEYMKALGIAFEEKTGE